MKKSYAILIGMLLFTQFVWSQEFKLMRFDEDYANISGHPASFYQKIKYIPFNNNGNIYLSIGGELRVEYDYTQNEDWGEINNGVDAFSLQRYQIHSDLHLGRRVRIFGQLRSGLEDGRKTGPRSKDEDQLNVQNLFIDLTPYLKADKSLTVRLGRQELRYGSGRLIDVRDGPNLRRYFDGFKLLFKTPTLSADAFVMSTPEVNTGVFDDHIGGSANLWGLYNTITVADNGLLELYYLGINRPKAEFDEGTGKELRHTIGTRYSKQSHRFIQNFEAIYQFGNFGPQKGRITAWALSSDLGYILQNVWGKPVIKLRGDLISGDRNNADGQLQTFNPLFPNGGYFGMNPQIGPANLLAIHPAIAWHPVKQLEFTLDGVFNWRQSVKDGIYGAGGQFMLSSEQTPQRYIGSAYMTTMTWQINQFIEYNLGIQYFKTGSFLNSRIPTHKNGLFIGTALSLKF